MKNSTLNSYKSFVLALCLLFSASVFGATVTYNVATGNWTEAANWSTQAPVAGDNIVIPAGAVVTVSTDLSAIKYNKITVNGKLIIAEMGKLNIEQTVLASPIFDIVGGEVENAGGLVIKQTLANNSTVALQFSDHADRDDKFTNTGVLTIDNTVATNSSTTGRSVSFTQISADRTARFVMGGTMNLNIKTQMRFIELMGGNAEISGTATIGSPTDYKNWRFLHLNLANGATNSLTFTPDANITVYTAFDSMNGCININTVNNGTVSLINKGTLTLNGGGTFTTGAYGINVNPQASSTGATNAILINEGILNISGNFPGGGIFLTGAAQTGSLPVFNNMEGAILNISNSASGINATAIRATNTAVATIVTNNSGAMNLSTVIPYSMLYGKNNSTFNNTGVVNVDKSITGYDNSSTGCIISNNAGGVFNFNVADNEANAISTNNKIIFTNNGGTVTGRGVIGAGTFVPSTGTLSPGDNAGIGTFTFSDESLALTGKAVMNINGVAESNSDKILSTGSLDISGLELEVIVDEAYSPGNQDLISLVSASSRIGNFASVTAPTKWVTNYTATSANLLYDNSTEIRSSSENEIKVYVQGQEILIKKGSGSLVLIQLVDMTGRILKQEILTAESNVLNAGNMKGVYMVRVFSTTGDYSQKVIL